MLKKTLKVTALIVAILFTAIQLFQIDRSRPQIVNAETMEAAVNVPAEISLILGRSCNDCHSHKTVFPWYSYIQPAGWFLKDHVEHGSEHLNFSVFNTYSGDKKAKKLDEVCEEVKSGRMPLPSYLWLHGNAALSESERRALCDWAESERGKIDRNGGE